MGHGKKSPLAGKTVLIRTRGTSDPDNEINGQPYLVEDWWDRLGVGSWMFATGNPACLKYAMRSGFGGLPTDDEVLYGRVGPFGHLVHISEIVTGVMAGQSGQ